MQVNDHFKRIRSLCGSLDCVLIAAEMLEDNSACIGNAIFLMNELNDAIEASEGMLIEPAAEE